MKDILNIYGIPSEIVNAILMLYKNIRSMVRSPDGDTPFFYITTEVLHGDKLVQSICIIFSIFRATVEPFLVYGFIT